MKETKLSSIYEQKDDKMFYQPYHAHPNTELVFYLKGDGNITIGEDSYHFHDNCVSVINAQTAHNERHDAPYDIIFLMFSFDQFQIPDGVYKLKNFPVFERILRQILNEVSSPKYGFNLFISLKIEELMVLLIREILNNNFDEKIHECMLYLSENCHKDIDVKLLSENHNIGYETFRHKFKKMYGMSPKNFIIAKRLFKANDLLLNSSLSCTKIAYECGFSDSAQFSKLFKRQFGISPKQFKNNYKKQH